MRVTMHDPEQVLLEEIADPQMTRRSVAMTYHFAMRAEGVNWAKVNEAICARWSVSALDWIKRQAHSGRCFQ